jgi:superfamily I DNA/RNA helicase
MRTAQFLGITCQYSYAFFYQATIRAGPIPLPRAEYTALNRKSNVNQKLREQIYSLFEQYVVLKQEQSLFDICDALQHIHVQLQVKQASFLPIDYIYCDEVQDLLPAQISLLKYLNVDPKQSFVLAGDTAQVHFVIIWSFVLSSVSTILICSSGDFGGRVISFCRAQRCILSRILPH